ISGSSLQRGDGGSLVHALVNHAHVVHARLVGPERISATEHSFSLGLENGPIPVGTARYSYEHVFCSQGPPHRQDRPAHHPGPATALLRPAALRRGRLG